MKRREIIKRIAKSAKANGVEWGVLREGASHTVFDLGGTLIPIPRHVEIGEGLTKEIFKQAEAQLPKNWWR